MAKPVKSVLLYDVLPILIFVFFVVWTACLFAKTMDVFPFASQHQAAKQKWQSLSGQEQLDLAKQPSVNWLYGFFVDNLLLMERMEYRVADPDLLRATKAVRLNSQSWHDTKDVSLFLFEAPNGAVKLGAIESKPSQFPDVLSPLLVANKPDSDTLIKIFLASLSLGNQAQRLISQYMTQLDLADRMALAQSIAGTQSNWVAKSFSSSYSLAHAQCSVKDVTAHCLVENVAQPNPKVDEYTSTTTEKCLHLDGRLTTDWVNCSSSPSIY